MGAGRVRARRGSGSVRNRNGQLLAHVSLGTDPSGRRIRRAKSFDSRTQAETWIATQQLEHRQLMNPVTEAAVTLPLPSGVRKAVAVIPMGPKTSARFGEVNQCSTSSTACVAMTCIRSSLPRIWPAWRSASRPSVTRTRGSTSRISLLCARSVVATGTGGPETGRPSIVAVAAG